MTTIRRGKADLSGRRVAYVIDSLGAGGAERSLAELLPFYFEAGLEVSVVCIKRRDVGVEEEVRSLGCELNFLPDGTRRTKARALRQILVEGQIDLMHTTLFDANLIGRIAAMGTGVPVLTSLVDTAYDAVHLSDPNLKPYRLRLVQLIDLLSARFLTAHFHAISHAVEESAKRTLRLRGERITVIERGRDRSRLGSPGPSRRLESRRRLGLDPDVEIVLSTGRQEHRKGQRYLLQAIQPLMRSRPRLVLLIAGRPGHATAELQALAAKLDLPDRVRFLGHRADVPDLLAAADLFVFPSLSEGLGGAVLEAMAMGLPVVASDIPAMWEVVENHGSGLLVTPGSSIALTNALKRMLDDPELARRFGERGRILFEERFTIERSAERMLQLYERLMDSPRTSQVD